MSIEEAIKTAVRQGMEPLLVKINTLEGYLVQLMVRVPEAIANSDHRMMEMPLAEVKLENLLANTESSKKKLEDLIQPPLTDEERADMLIPVKFKNVGSTMNGGMSGPSTPVVEMAEDPLPTFTDSAEFLSAIKKLCADTETEPVDLKAKLVGMGYEKFSVVPEEMRVSIYTQLKEAVSK